MMKKTVPAASPEAYVRGLDGWQKPCVASLRKAVLASARLEEAIKWGHLVYFSNGPALLIRAEEERVLFGFRRGQRLQKRGQRLQKIEERLKPGGKYEMATIGLREVDRVTAATVRRLVEEAVKLNKKLGDPTKIRK